MSSGDDDPPCLSAETFAALQEFYAEKSKRQEILEKLEKDDQLKENILFDEDWQLSQFWYNETTIQSIVKVVANVLPPKGSVCLISCPTLYIPIRRTLDFECSVKLLEFDRRFEVYEDDFIFYDFNFPLKLPLDCGKFDIIVADPPFLSEECLSKTSETIKILSKDKIILCTGAVMSNHAKKFLNVQNCQFKPQHRNNLANEFSCFANFDFDSVVR